MGKLSTVFVVAQSTAGIMGLTAGAAILGESTALIYAGRKEEAKGAKTLYYLGDMENKSYLEYIPSIVSLVKEKKPQLVLLETTKNGRITAAALGTALDTSVMTDVSELSAENGVITGKRMVYGGAAFHTFSVSAETVVACAGTGVFDAADAIKPVEIVDVPYVGAPARIKFLSSRQKSGQTVDLSAAKYVVGVGRGIGKEENMKLARDLADAIGGELGATRPVAEEEKWLPESAFIGISGNIIKPDVYIACGVSGQIQHMTGISQARTIVAVNKEKSAPIFRKCDYGIVGDLHKVLPALTEKLQV